MTVIRREPYTPPKQTPYHPDQEDDERKLNATSSKVNTKAIKEEFQNLSLKEPTALTTPSLKERTSTNPPAKKCTSSAPKCKPTQVWANITIPQPKTSESSWVTVPNGMTRADTLKGLWECSSPAPFFGNILDGNVIQKKQEEHAWKDANKIEKDLQKTPRVDYFAGRCIKVNMSQHPEINLDIYLRDCNTTMTAEEVLNKCLKPNNIPTQPQSDQPKPYQNTPLMFMPPF